VYAAAEEKFTNHLSRLGRQYDKYLRIYVIKGDLKVTTMKSGMEYMISLVDWYPKQCQ
jgi:hypothetical protein